MPAALRGLPGRGRSCCSQHLYGPVPPQCPCAVGGRQPLSRSTLGPGRGLGATWHVHPLVVQLGLDFRCFLHVSDPQIVYLEVCTALPYTTGEYGAALGGTLERGANSARCLVGLELVRAEAHTMPGQLERASSVCPGRVLQVSSRLFSSPALGGPSREVESLPASLPSGPAATALGPAT